MNNQPKIVLVDDDESFLELFISLSEAQNYEILSFTSAIEALKIIATEQVDLVISDIQMPEMTGIELFETVFELYPDVPVILITAFGSIEKAIYAVKRGAYHYFQKPLNSSLALFWTTVHQAVEKRKLSRELASLRKEIAFEMRRF